MHDLSKAWGKLCSVTVQCWAIVVLGSCTNWVRGLRAWLALVYPLSLILLIIFMDRISKHSHSLKGLIISGSCSCFMQMMWFCWLKLAPGLFASVKHLRWELAPCSLKPWFSTRNSWSPHSGLGMSSCPRWKSFSILGRVEREMDWQISVVLAVMQTLYWSVVVARDPSVKARVD